MIMNDQQITQTFNEICQLLASRKLKPGFDLLEQLINETGSGDFRDEYHNLEQTYKYMLQYTVEGINDPERQKVYKHLLISAFELTDKVIENLRMRFSALLPYQKKRGFAHLYLENLSKTYHEIEDFHVHNELQSLIDESISPQTGKQESARIHTEKLNYIFYHFWFRDLLNYDELNFVRNFLSGESIPIHEKALLVTALTFSLARYFDEQKFNLLFEAYDTTDELVRQRALVGLMISLYQYDLRLPFFTQITGRLAILNEDPEFKRLFEKVILQFIRSKETEKLQRRLQDEILPEMMRISPNLRNKLNMDNLMGEGMMDDKNPDWQDIFSESPGLMDKLEELSELQMEGADVFMSSFSMLKNFPFFSEFVNWFMPFFPEHPEISDVTGDKSDESTNTFMEAIVKSPMLCNSDKYSFCLSLQNIPKEYKEMMSGSLKAEMDQLEEIQQDELAISPNKAAEVASNQYIQDLYRFFKLHPNHTDFEDVFSWRLDFHNKNTFRPLLQEDLGILRKMAEFYFAKNYFDEASEIYQMLLQEGEDGEILQKLAFCYQKTGNYRDALNFYLKADLFDVNKIWNHKKIALCYRNLKEPEKALDYYKQAEILEPDNMSTHISIGHCYMELKKYEDALKYYFKVEYLSPGNKNVWRPLAWSSLLVGKLEQSENYYRKLIEGAPNKYDLMNMGHVQWCLGNRKAALEWYRKSIRNKENSEAEFMAAFEEDLEHLLRQGIDPEDVPIMLDQLRYSLEA